MTLFKRWALGAQILALSLSATTLTETPAEPTFEKEANSVLVLNLKEALNDASLDHINRALSHARIRGNPALLLELDSIGGFAESIQHIVPLILSSDIPVLVWITGDQAQSASSSIFVSLSGHLLTMHPGATLGEAPQNKDLSESRQKRLEGESISYLSALSKKRLRQMDWVKTLLRNGTFFSAEQALEQNLIDGLASTQSEVWTLARQKFPALPQDVKFVDFKKNPKEKFEKIISNPDTSFGLLSVGALGLYAELTHPGLLIPGAIGSLAITLGIVSMKLIPIRPQSVAIFLVGLFIIGIELLTPLITYGIAGFLGAACLFWSGFFLVDKAQSDVVLDVVIWVPIFVVMLISMVVFGWQSYQNTQANPYGPGPILLVNKDATVKTVINPGEALVSVHGYLWSARWNAPESSQEFVPGDELIVKKQRGFTLFVDRKKT